MAKGRRDENVLATFLNKLRRDLSGFKTEAVEVQLPLANLIWDSGTHRREHREQDGMSITWQHLEQRFGRGKFVDINTRLDIFDITNWSKSKNLTRAFKLKPAVQKIVTNYLHHSREFPSQVVAMDGQNLRTLPKAIASKDTAGITARAWAKAKELTNKIPVDLLKLKALKDELKVMLNRQTGSLFGNPEPERVDYCLDMVAKLLRQANTDVAGHGYVSLRYVEAKSGRLYARGVNLQTVPKLIKQVALHGLWEYDFENCHYSIFQQMAARFDFQCVAIADYLAHKKKTRTRLAHDIGISEDQAKVCLLAIMYGARTSEWHENAIPEAIGSKAANLYHHPTFANINAEIRGGREAIIAGWKKRSKTLLNEAGKSIATSTTKEKVLAHLIQGVEAKMLRAAFDIYPQEIVLLQHDGFVSQVQLDRPRIEQAIHQKTGYQIVVSEAQIAVSPDHDLSKP